LALASSAEGRSFALALTCLTRPKGRTALRAGTKATFCSQSQFGHCCHLRGWGTARVEAALWLSVVVCSGPLRAVVNGTLVARPAMEILIEVGATGPVTTVGSHRL